MSLYPVSTVLGVGAHSEGKFGVEDPSGEILEELSAPTISISQAKSSLKNSRRDIPGVGRNKLGVGVLSVDTRKVVDTSGEVIEVVSDSIMSRRRSKNTLINSRRNLLGIGVLSAAILGLVISLGNILGVIDTWGEELVEVLTPKSSVRRSKNSLNSRRDILGACGPSGDIFGVNAPSGDILGVTDPSVVEEVLTQKISISRSKNSLN